MPLQFNRQVRVDLDGRSLSGLRIRFRVRKTRSKVPNEATVEIYNASGATVGAASSGEMRLYAGYLFNPPLLSAGEIRSVSLDRRPPDAALIIEAQEGINTLREKRVSLSFEAGATVKQIIEAIAETLEAVVRPLDSLDLSAVMRGGFAHVGGAGEALDAAVSRIKGFWSLQNGELQILPESGRVERAPVLLSPVTGMLYSPERVEARLSTEKAGAKPRTGYRVTCLLQPQIEPGDPVVLVSTLVSGEFVVDEVIHRGDTHGPEFHTIATVFS